MTRLANNLNKDDLKERYGEEYPLAEMIEVQILAAKFPRGLSSGCQVRQFHFRILS